MPTPYDVEGSAHWYNKPDHIVIVHRPDEAINETVIRIAKVRFEETGAKGHVSMAFNRDVQPLRAAGLAAEPMTAPVVEVFRRRGPRPVEPPSAPLPPAVLAALAAIVRDMRDVPRDCFMDRAEMITWLNRMARRVEGVASMKAPLPALPRPSGLPRTNRGIPAVLTARQAAEAAFASPSKACAVKGLGDQTLRSTSATIAAGHALAEAVFGSAPTTGKSQAVARRPDTRTIVNRKGRAVRVEVRRARASGQMELGV